MNKIHVSAAVILAVATGLLAYRRRSQSVVVSGQTIPVKTPTRTPAAASTPTPPAPRQYSSEALLEKHGFDFHGLCAAAQVIEYDPSWKEYGDYFRNLLEAQLPDNGDQCTMYTSVDKANRSILIFTAPEGRLVIFQRYSDDKSLLVAHISGDYAEMVGDDLTNSSTAAWKEVAALVDIITKKA